MPTDAEALKALADRVGDEGMRELGWQRVRVYTEEEQKEIDRIKYQMPVFEDPSMDGLRELFAKQKEEGIA
jgi:hypothetical protein